MQSTDSVSSHNHSAYALWVDVLEDLPGINITEVLNEAATSLFSTLSFSQTKGLMPVAGIKIATDKDVQILNRDFRDKDKPTNVLSFQTDIEDALIDDEPDEEPVFYLGDIIIAVGVVTKEANDAQKPLEHHLTHLAIHGLLHLMGFDHETEVQANLMETLEVKILNHLNINNPYEIHVSS